MTYTKIIVPTEGERITTREGKLHVSDNPILLWIEGDGIGPDIVTASKRIWDAAVQAVYGGQRKIAWMEIYSGEKAAAFMTGTTSRPRAWMPSVSSRWASRAR